MTKRKVDSADYKGAGTSSDALAVQVADWEARLEADMANESQLGVGTSKGLRTGADVSRESQLGVEAGQYRQGKANVAVGPQLGLTPARELGNGVDLPTGPQPTFTPIRSEPLDTEEGNPVIQATAEEDLGSGPLYTDFWALLADAGYETW